MFGLFRIYNMVIPVYPENPLCHFVNQEIPGGIFSNLGRQCAQWGVGVEAISKPLIT